MGEIASLQARLSDAESEIATLKKEVQEFNDHTIRYENAFVIVIGFLEDLNHNSDDEKALAELKELFYGKSKENGTK